MFKIYAVKKGSLCLNTKEVKDFAKGVYSYTFSAISLVETKNFLKLRGSRGGFGAFIPVDFFINIFAAISVFNNHTSFNPFTGDKCFLKIFISP